MLIDLVETVFKNYNLAGWLYVFVHFIACSLAGYTLAIKFYGRRDIGEAEWIISSAVLLAIFQLTGVILASSVISIYHSFFLFIIIGILFWSIELYADKIIFTKNKCYSLVGTILFYIGFSLVVQEPEYFVGGSDQGAYTFQAHSMDIHHSYVHDDEVIDRMLGELSISKVLPLSMRLTSDGEITTSWSKGWSILASQFSLVGREFLNDDYSVYWTNSFIGILFLISTYSLGCQIGGSKWVGILASLFLCVDFLFIYFCKTPMVEVLSGFYAVVTLLMYLSWRGQMTSIKYLAITSLIIGSLLTKPEQFLVIGIVLALSSADYFLNKINLKELYFWYASLYSPYIIWRYVYGPFFDQGVSDLYFGSSIVFRDAVSLVVVVILAVAPIVCKYMFKIHYYKILKGKDKLEYCVLALVFFVMLIILTMNDYKYLYVIVLRIKAFVSTYQYATIPILAGLIFIFSKLKSNFDATMVVLICAIGMAMVPMTLYEPNVSRRMLILVLPILYIAVSNFVVTICKRMNNRIAIVGVYSLTIAMLLTSLNRSAKFFHEYRGMSGTRNFVENLTELIPLRSIIVLDTPSEIFSSRLYAKSYYSVRGMESIEDLEKVSKIAKSLNLPMVVLIGKISANNEYIMRNIEMFEKIGELSLTWEDIAGYAFLNGDRILYNDEQSYKLRDAFEISIEGPRRRTSNVVSFEVYKKIDNI